MQSNTIPIDSLLAGGRLGGGDDYAAHLTGRAVLNVPARDIQRESAAAIYDVDMETLEAGRRVSRMNLGEER